MKGDSIASKVLQAAAKVTSVRGREIQLGHLVMACWQLDWQTFGLQPFAESHPDSNKVIAAVVGKRGLIARGLLEKIAPKTYALTSAGRVAVLRAAGIEPTRLDFEKEVLLFCIWDELAYLAWLEGRLEDITFTDALIFWGLGETARGPGVVFQIKKFFGTLEEVQEILKGEERGEIVLSNGRVLRTADLDQVMQLHQELCRKFTRQISVLSRL